jgi:hypothetical protein
LYSERGIQNSHGWNRNTAAARDISLTLDNQRYIEARLRLDPA